MRRVAVLAAAVTCLVVPALLGAEKVPSHSRTEFVELDAVVTGDGNRLVQGLHQADFEIQEDGRPVTVTSFAEVSAAGISGRDDRRSVVLLLDDIVVSPSLTQAVRGIARLFMGRARPLDDVAVVRLSHHDDEAVGDLQEALTRIDGYRGGAFPYFWRETVENSLKTVASVAEQLESLEHRRKNVVCIGARNVCDLYLQTPENAMVWSSWLDAISATARSNVAVYVVDPSGLRGQLDLGGGLVDQTGGDDFVASNNFQRAVDRIWDEAGHYYLLGYTPTARPRKLHSIEIKVKRAGLHVRGRRSRGD
jgi:VWFA-related protein